MDVNGEEVTLDQLGLGRRGEADGDVGFALAPWVIGTEAYERLGIDADTYNKPGFHLLRFWGQSDKEIGEINDVVIGRMTVEGAPHLRVEHLPVFDCANRCGKIGERFLEPMAHVT